MAYENLIIEERGHIRIITINRPKVHNALNKRVLSDLLKVLYDSELNNDIRCLIITGAGEKSFISGADIHELKALNPLEAVSFSKLGHKVMETIFRHRVPIIAAVNGYALGGGLELALACDFMYASENASFGLVESRLSLIPGFGGIARLAAKVGLAMAKEMIFTGAQINATEALRIGLVNKVVLEGEVLEACKVVAEKISERGPYAVSLAKKLLNDSVDTPLNVANAMEQLGFGLIFASKDHEEGISAFLEKRSASFDGV